MINKSTLIEKVAKDTEVSKKDAKNIINATLTEIQDDLTKGERVQLTGFGSFEVRQHGARQGRNPQTGEKMLIPANKVPFFKAGQLLRKAVRNK